MSEPLNDLLTSIRRHQERLFKMRQREIAILDEFVTDDDMHESLAIRETCEREENAHHVA